MADKLNRGQGLGPNTGLSQNSIKLGGSGLTAKDNSIVPAGDPAWELEDGSGRWELEDGSGVWLLET